MLFLLNLTYASDIIILQNNDKISGEIVEAKEGKLEIKSSYAGKIKVSLYEIKTISTTQKFAVKLKSGQSLISRFNESSQNGYVVLERSRPGLDRGQVIIGAKGVASLFLILPKSQFTI